MTKEDKVELINKMCFLLSDKNYIALENELRRLKYFFDENQVTAIEDYVFGINYAFYTTDEFCKNYL